MKASDRLHLIKHFVFEPSVTHRSSVFSTLVPTLPRTAFQMGCKNDNNAARMAARAPLLEGAAQPWPSLFPLRSCGPRGGGGRTWRLPCMRATETHLIKIAGLCETSARVFGRDGCRGAEVRPSFHFQMEGNCAVWQDTRGGARRRIRSRAG